jgi:hypothetical protein
MQMQSHLARSSFGTVALSDSNTTTSAPFMNLRALITDEVLARRSRLGRILVAGHHEPEHFRICIAQGGRGRL